MGKIYARKLIRPFGAIKWEHVRNEIRAIAKLCVCRHENIVQVLTHGRVPGSPYYFIDMELCDVDLASYIDRTCNRAFQGEVAVGAEAMGTNSWEILNDITSGLIFIHQLKEIHRDLKPSNGKIIYL